MMLTGGHDAGAYRDYHDQGDDNLATSAVYAQVNHDQGNDNLATSAVYAQVNHDQGMITLPPVLSMHR